MKGLWRIGLEPYGKALVSPAPWVRKAKHLKRAADKLDPFQSYPDLNKAPQEEKNMLPIFMFLFGLALENMLKGLVVLKKGGGDSEGRLRRGLKTHDFEKLLLLIGNGFSFSQDEQKVPHTNRCTV